MEYYPIKFSGNLTSYHFYHSILRQLHKYYRTNSDLPIIFDFTRVDSIDTLVIPNLLCVGYIITKNSDMVPHFRISDNIKASLLKRYLNEIKFVELAESFGLYKFDSSIKGGWSPRGIQKLSTTMLFNSDESEETAWNRLFFNTNKFANEFLSNFDHINHDQILTNSIIDICHEIIKNSKEWGGSFAFMSIQYNNHLEKVYISISDCGIGFMEAYNYQIDDGNPHKLFINEKAHDEMSAIIQGLFARSNSKTYGLYHVFRHIIRCEGIVRIHSMNTQIIITPRLCIPLEIGDNRQSFELLMKSDELKANLRKNLKFGGVHIEFEIPFSKIK